MVQNMHRLAWLLIPIAACAQPSAKEAALGKALADDFARRSRILDDSVVESYVRALARDLAAASGRTAIVDVVEDGSPNAAAFPGGYVYVSSGLIVSAGSEVELAGMLAHAIAHATRPLGGARMVLGGRSGLCSRFGDNLLPIARRAAQQEAERHADLDATAIADQAGYGASAIRLRSSPEFEMVRSRLSRRSGTRRPPSLKDGNNQK